MESSAKLGGEAGYIHIILGFFHIFLWFSGAKRDIRGQWEEEGSSRHLSREDPVPQINFICRTFSKLVRMYWSTEKIVNLQSKINRVIFKSNIVFNNNNMVCGKNMSLRIHASSIPKSAPARHSRQPTCAAPS